MVVFIFAALTQSNFLGPLLNFRLDDFTKAPLPPYRDSVARSIGSAAIYFSIIEGTTPYNAKIDAPVHFVELSKMWYAPYFLLGRELIQNCLECGYSLVEFPTLYEATSSAVTHPLKVIKK